MMARGTTRVGAKDSSPSEPADSKPANARKPDTAANASADTPTPGGSTKTEPEKRGPPGARPAASHRKIAPMSTGRRQPAPISKPSTDGGVAGPPRAASTPMTAQEARASGYQSALP